MSRERGSLVDRLVAAAVARLVAAAVALFVAAAALSLAVHLIEAIWLPLVVILAGGVGLASAIRFVRGRRDGW